MANNRQTIKKQPTGFGMFVRKDVNGRPCCIGDKVKIFTPKQTVSREDEEIGSYNIEVAEHSISGTLILRLSEGLMLKTDGGLYYKISYSPYCSKTKRIWELI